VVIHDDSRGLTVHSTDQSQSTSVSRRAPIGPTTRDVTANSAIDGRASRSQISFRVHVLGPMDGPRLELDFRWCSSSGVLDVILPSCYVTLIRVHKLQTGCAQTAGVLRDLHWTLAYVHALKLSFLIRTYQRANYLR